MISFTNWQVDSRFSFLHLLPQSKRKERKGSKLPSFHFPHISSQGKAVWAIPCRSLGQPVQVKVDEILPIPPPLSHASGWRKRKLECVWWQGRLTWLSANSSLSLITQQQKEKRRITALSYSSIAAGRKPIKSAIGPISPIFAMIWKHRHYWLRCSQYSNSSKATYI